MGYEKGLLPHGCETSEQGSECLRFTWWQGNHARITISVAEHIPSWLIGH